MSAPGKAAALAGAALMTMVAIQSSRTSPGDHSFGFQTKGSIHAPAYKNSNGILSARIVHAVERLRCWFIFTSEALSPAGSAAVLLSTTVLHMPAVYSSTTMSAVL